MKRCQTTLGNARRPSDECTKTSPENSLNYQPPWVWTISRCGNQASVALKFRCCFTESDFGSRSTLRNRGYTSTEIRTPPATGEPEATPNELLQATPQLTAAGQFGIPIWQPVSVVDPELV